ncbi:MAG: OprD family outer membrane porin, partial [Dissulfurimicrobium sp.]
MGTQAIGESNPGVTSIAAIYSGIPGVTLQIWDYYAYEMLNAVYLQGDYTIGFGGVKTILSAQYINETNVGNNIKDVLGKDVGSNLFAAKLAVKPTKYLMFYGAYSITASDTDKALNGGFITPWGVSLGFVQGTVTRLAYTADTDAWKLGVSYDVIDGLNLHLAYTYFNVGDKAVYFNRTTIRAKDASETDFDLTYKVQYVKNLELKLRGIYAHDFI